jgi:hypothetical protein
MSDGFYVDGIGAVVIRDGVARLELVRLGQAAGDKVSVSTVTTMSVSLPGLIRIQQDLQNVVSRLVADGVLQPRSAEVVNGTPSGEHVGSEIKAQPRAGNLA